MGALRGYFQTDGLNLFPHNPSILARCGLEALAKTPGPEKFGPDHQRIFQPLRHRGAGAFGNPEPDRFLGFALQHRCPFFDPSGRHDVNDFHLHKVTPAQFAINGHIEQSQIAMVLRKFQPDADRPDMFGLSWSLLANNAPLIPRGAKCANGR
jgi:hypothetical protein